MNDFLTTNELIQMVDHTRESINQLVKSNDKSLNVGKLIFWIATGVLALFMVYLSLPLYLNSTQVVDIMGSQPLAVVKKDQTPPSLNVTISIVKNFDFEDLVAGDYVIVYNEENNVYLEKLVVSVDLTGETFTATYTGQTADTYTIDDLVGVYRNDASLLGASMFAIQTVRGYLGTLGVLVLILGVSYYLMFKSNVLKENEDSE